MHRRLIALFVCSCAGVLSAQQSKPNPQTPVFRTGVELINVDVTVTDKDGNQIRGLKQTDFAITDRKKPQTVATFDEISHERATAAPSPATMFPASMKMDVIDNQSSQADRLIMMVIDDLHIWKGRTDKTKDIARDVITKLGAQASMAVLFTSGERSTQLTQDRSQLLAAVDKMQARQSVRRPHQAIEDQKAGFNASSFDVSDDSSSLKQMNNMASAQQTSLQDFQDNMRQFQVLNDAAKMLRVSDNRRKAFVLISEGMSKDMSGIFDATATPCETTSMQAPCYQDRALRDAMESLRRSNVTTYAIDPRGKVKPEDMMLESFPPPSCAACAADGSAAGNEDSQFAWNNPVRLSQSSLGLTAEASGGFAVTDTDDYATGLQHIVEDIDHYYLIGFYSSDTSGGDKYRPLDVTVPAHPDWRVRFRRGYVPGNAAVETTKKDPLVSLADGIMPKSDLPLRITALPLVGKGKNANVVIALEVTASTGAMKDVDNKLRDDVTYQVMVIDDKKAKVTSRDGRAASFALSAKNPAQAMPDTVTYQIPLSIDLPPGEYQLRASAMSKKLGQGGSVYLGVTVPDFTKESLVLSGIVLGYADGSHVPVGRNGAGQQVLVGAAAARGSDRYGAIAPSAAKGTSVAEMPEAQVEQRRLPFDPSLARTFSRADKLRTYFEVSRKDMKSTVNLTITVVDAANKAIMAIDKQVGPDDKGQIDLELPLAALSPGAYRVRVSASDTRTAAKTETGIIVR